MKKILLLLATAVAVAAPLGATPVMFPLKSFFYGANYTRGITITAVWPWLTDGNSIYAGSFITLTPAGGTNPIIELAPNDYTVALADVRTPLRFSVPDTNVVMNVLTLIANGLSSYTPVIIGNAPVTAGFGLVSTRAGTSNNLSVDPNLIATNGQPLTLAQLPVQAMTTANANSTNMVSSLASPFANEINPMPIAYISWQGYGPNFTGALLTNLVNNMNYYGSIMQNIAPFIVVVDDGWQAPTRDASGRLQMDPVKWPDTPNHYTEYCRANGIRMMLFTEPNVTTDSGEVHSPGSWGTNLTFDAQTMADWGMVGCKVDHATRDGSDPSGTIAASVLKEFSSAFRARSTNGPCYFLCDVASGLGDTTNMNASLLNNSVSGFMFRSAPEYTSYGTVSNLFQCHAVMMLLFDHFYENFRVLNSSRNYVFFNEFENRYTGEAIKTWANLLAVSGNCLAYASLVIPATEQISTTTNREFLLANLDSARNQVKLVPNVGSKTNYQIYTREMANGDKLVLLLNRTTNNTYTIPVLWTNVGIGGSQLMRVRDIYNLTNVGNFSRGFTNTVGPMGSLLVRISPTIDASAIVGTLPVKQSHYELSVIADTWTDPANSSWGGTIGESPAPEYNSDCLYNITPTVPISRYFRIPSWATSVTGSYGIAYGASGTVTNTIQLKSFDGGTRIFGSVTTLATNVGTTTVRMPFTYGLGTATNKVMVLTLTANTNSTKELVGPLILDFQ